MKARANNIAGIKKACNYNRYKDRGMGELSLKEKRMISQCCKKCRSSKKNNCYTVRCTRTDTEFSSGPYGICDKFRR